MSGDGGIDLGAMGAKLSRLAEDLHRSAEGLRQAAAGATAQVYETTSTDGLMWVQVDGRCRVVSMRLNPRATRLGREGFHALVAATLNDAFAQARAGARESVAQAVPPSMRAWLAPDNDDAQGEQRR